MYRFYKLMYSSPVVSASGQIICHRFYYFYSFQQCHPFFGSSFVSSSMVVAMACFFIGSKIEEELQPVPRTVKAFYQIYQERTGQPLTQLSDTDAVLHFPSLYPRYIFDGGASSSERSSSSYLPLAITSTVSWTIPTATFSSS